MRSVVVICQKASGWLTFSSVHDKIQVKKAKGELLMFCNYSELLNNSDLFNIQRKRNISNTERYLYNCAGYALETFSWYCPNEEDWEYWGYEENLSDAEMFAKTFETVKFMLKDWKGHLRLIGSVDEVRENEYAIAYRVSSDG